MATILIPIEDYLRNSNFEPDAEYVEGVIEERPMGEEDHAKWQGAIFAYFYNRSREWNIRVRPELRTRVATRRVRIPDVAIFDAATLPEPVPTTPPLAIFEVLSPEDRLPRVALRLDDFAAMGVKNIYVVQPQDGALFRYAEALRPTEEVRLRDRTITWAEITATVL